MTLSDDSCVACSEIKQSLDRLRSDLPELKVIADGFENLFLQVALIKDKIPDISPDNSEIDAIRFGQGVPILKNWKIDLPKELFFMSAEAILPTMQECFPKISETLAKFLEYIREQGPQSYSFLSQDQTSSSEIVLQIGKDLGFQTELIQFVTTQITKPFAEKISDSLTPLPSNLSWTKGYCPVCGSWPEISFIKGTDGKRSLRCSFCGHEWAFARLVCPFCENDDQTKLELFYSEDRSFERAELCHECKKYIVGLDTRNLVLQPAAQVAAIGMIYLDILAQEKGFTPGAICAWNVIETPNRQNV